MVDSLTLYHSEFHNVRLIDNNDSIIEGYVDLYESEDDSGSGFAEIGLSNGRMYRQDEIKSLELI